MPPTIVIPQSLQEGELWAAALGFGISTFTVCGRIYTKTVLTKSMKIEDCKW